MDKYLNYSKENPRKAFGVVSLLALLLFLFFFDFNWWIFLCLLVGFGAFYYLFFIYKFTIVKIAWFVWFVILSPLFLLVIFYIGYEALGTNTTTVTTLTPEQCKPIYDKYNDSVYDVTADDLTGVVKIAIDPTDCYADIDYVFQYPLNIKQNGQFTGTYVGYFAELYKDEPRSEWTGNGSIFPIYRNSGLFPQDFDDTPYFYDVPEKASDPSDSFYHHFGKKYEFNEEAYQKFLSYDSYAVIDGTDYIEAAKADDGSLSSDVVENMAAPKAPIIKEYNLTYTRR